MEASPLDRGPQPKPFHDAWRLPCPVTLELAQLGDALALEVVERRAAAEPAPTSLDERITRAVAAAGHPVQLLRFPSSTRELGTGSPVRQPYLAGLRLREVAAATC